MAGLLSLGAILLLKEGNKMILIKSIATVGVLSLSLLLTGCSSGTQESTAKTSASPNSTDTELPSDTPEESESPQTTSPKGLDYTQPIKLAKNDLELEFLNIAFDSCEKAQRDGLIVTSSKDKTYFRPIESDDFPNWPYWPFEQVTVTDGKVGAGIYVNYLPSFFEPCDLEIQARLVEPDAAVLEHEVDRWANNSYGWKQHHGGQALDETVYQVTDGLITRYGRYNNLDTVISYGPFTAEEQALFDEVYK